MPWQQHVLDVALELDADGHPAYRRIVLTVPRQSGKTTLQLALFVHRALAWGSPQVMAYAAQTGKDARTKMTDDQLGILKQSPFRSLYRPRLTNGHEAILWRNGSRHVLAANTEKSGHGSTLDLGLIDEAFSQVDARLEQAFSPAMSTRPDAQLWVVSTAGTAASTYLRSKVDAGRVTCHDTESGTAYFEWSADDDEPLDDPDTWRRCMPALGITVSERTIRSELASMLAEDNEDEFRRAYLNQWRDRGAGAVINVATWHLLYDPESRIAGPPTFALDVTPERDWSAVGVAGARADGMPHLELAHMAPGTGWVVPWIAERMRRWGSPTLVLDPSSAAGSLIGDLVRAGVDPLLVRPRDVAAGCGRLFDTVEARGLRHTGQTEITDALMSAKKRPLADAWAWDKKNVSGNIAPVVALTLALWGHAETASYDPLANFLP
jgi:phage terminase large subunit-like protein